MSERHHPSSGKVYFRILSAAFLLLGTICNGQPTVTVSVTNPTCAYDNGGFVVTATGGNPPYVYFSTAARISNKTGIFGGLPAGTYDLTVQDLKGKRTTTSVVLTSPGTFPYFTSAVVDATGCNTNNGRVTLTPAGGMAPYQYSINDGASFQSGNVFSNLPPGSYSILIKDANGCITAPWSAIGVSYADFQLWSRAGFVKVGAPNCSLVMSATQSAPSCGKTNSISITNTTGGTGPYTYALDGGPFGALAGGGFSGLSPGVHTVTVRDAAGVEQSYDYTFPNDCVLTTTQTPSQCGGSSGTMTVTAASGIPPLTYSIDGTNFQGSPTFSGLAAGTYTVMVRDAYGAITYGSGNVSQICLAAVATSNPSQCDASTGSITAKGVNGTPGYTYSIDGVNFVASNVFSNLAGGYYTVTVKDSKGQTARTVVAVGDVCMTVGATSTPASCGRSNGSITVNVEGGTGPYQYSLFSGSGYVNTNVIQGLGPAFYIVTIKDAHGNITTVPVTVQNVQGPQISAVPTAASCQNNDGAIQIIATGGSSPVAYSFNGGPAVLGQQNWTGLAKGSYPIAVTDALGCVDSTTALVSLTDSLRVSTGILPPTCQGVGVLLPDSTNANSFAWTPGDGLDNPNVAHPMATPSATTTYIVTATLGACLDTASVTVPVIPGPQAVAGGSDTVCPGKSAQLQGSGGVQYLWSPGIYLSDPTAANPTVNQPDATISYHLKVLGANGCWSVDSAVTTVVVTAPPKVFAGDDTVMVIGQPLQLDAVDLGGGGFSSYVWTPAEGLSDPNIPNPTTVVSGTVTYTVVATTALGCSATASIVIGATNVANIIVPNAFTPNNDGHNDVLRAIVFGIRSFQFFRVYNRLGQLVFATVDAGSGWDGAVGGQLAPAGTYVWSAAGVDYQGRPVWRKGTVILVR